MSRTVEQERMLDDLLALGIERDKCLRAVAKNFRSVQEAVESIFGGGAGEDDNNSVEIIGPQNNENAVPPAVRIEGSAAVASEERHLVHGGGSVAEISSASPGNSMILSRENTERAIVPVGPALPSGDDDLNRAIEMSMMEQRERELFNKEVRGEGKAGYKDPPNPFDRKRDNADLPAGIKNVGNTCYINSLLQAFFMIPEFRMEIFRQLVDDHGVHEGEKLIHELQALFSHMLLTERRYVDPQPLLRFTGHIGAQEDPTELLLSLLEKVREGVRHTKRAKWDTDDVQPMDLGGDDEEEATPQAPAFSAADDARADVVAKFFEGLQVQTVQAEEASGEVCSTSNQDSFQQIICSLPSADALVGQYDLHDLLEQYSSTSVIEGYQTPRGRVTEGKKTVFFKHLPPVLVIQLQRVAWSNNAARKNNRCIQFQSDLFMDRYLESNAAATTQKRQELELLRKEMANALQARQKISDWNGTALSAAQILQHADEVVTAMGGSGAQAVSQALLKYMSEADARLQGIVAHIEALRSTMAAAYEQFPKKHHYVLHAILVHSGSPDMGGHYWAYIVDHASKQWFKFNDVTVTRVGNVDEMMRETWGDVNGSTSAYALVYLRHGVRPAWNETAGLPDWARRLVERDNDAFRQELASWAAAAPPAAPVVAGAAVVPGSATLSQSMPVDLSVFEADFRDQLAFFAMVEGTNQFDQAVMLKFSFYLQMRFGIQFNRLTERCAKVMLLEDVMQSRFGVSVNALPSDARLVVEGMTGIQTACTLEERAHIDKMRADYNQYLVALRRIHAGLQRYFGDKSLLAVFPCAMQIAVVLRDVPAAALANMNHSTQVGCKYFAAKCSEVAFRALSDASKSPDQVLDLAEQAACVSISCQGFDDGAALARWRKALSASRDLPNSLVHNDRYERLLNDVTRGISTYHANPSQFDSSLSLAQVAQDLALLLQRINTEIFNGSSFKSTAAYSPAV